MKDQIDYLNKLKCPFSVEIRIEQEMKIAFDGGANVGEEVEAFLNKGYDRVVAIEPQSEFVDILKDKFGEDERVIIVQAALWYESGSEIKLHTSGYKTLSTVSRKWMEESRFASYGYNGSYPVETITLDDLIELYGVPEIIKLDIEGSELQALTGLSHPVKSISYEYLGELCEDAIKCAERITELGEYRFHIRSGESMTLENNLTLRDFIFSMRRNTKAYPTIWGMIDAERTFNE